MNANKPTARLIQAIQRIQTRKWSFLAVFLVVLFVVVSVCMVTGFIPDASADTSVAVNATSTDPFFSVTASPLLASAAAGADSADAAAPNGTMLNMDGELPVKITVASIGLSATVANPDTTNIDTLDSYLLHGAARYPTTATLDQQGTMVLFGHSSYLPVVINQAYKTFDGIQKLKAGDQITVYSTTHEYVYAVETVQQESAASGDSIPLSNTGHTLVLATCDSFGKKTDRFVVTSTLVGSYPLGN